MVSARNIRLALALLVTAAFVGIVAAVYLKGSRSSSPEPVSQQLPQNIDVALHNARFNEMSNGTNVWELVAKNAQYDKSGDVVYLSDVHLVYEKTRTNGAITLTSSKGEYSNVSKNIRLRGKVHVVTESGMIFDTETLDYLAKPSLFRTADPVTFHHDRLSLSATGMELEARTEKSRFYRLINAVVEGVKTH